MKILQASPDSQTTPWENLAPQKINKKLIAVTGYARSGKGSLCDALEKNLKREIPNLSIGQFAFAESLRREIAPFLIEQFHIDAWTNKTEQKEIIRPLLIGHGMSRRKQTQNQYWIKKLEAQIGQSPCDLALITDLRFAENETDELAWLHSNKGLHVHIRRFTTKNGKKIFDKAPNEYEKQNEQKLIKAAKEVIEIPRFENDSEFFGEINKISLEVISNNYYYFL